MKSTEKNEISSLPQKYKPLGAWGYFGYSILFNIPFIGLISLIIFSFNSGNINRRSFARSYFCIYIMLIIVFVAVILISGIGFAGFFDKIKELIKSK